jgi:acetyl esterase/lipase
MRSLLILILFAAVVPAVGAAESGRLTMTQMVALAPKPRADFLREWGRLRDRALAGAATEDARLAVRFEYAQGRVMYPFFHWRESDAPRIEADPDLGRVLAALPPIDTRLLERPEVREFVDARVHTLARERLAADANLRRGDARWLRAELRVLEDVVPNRAAWLRQAAKILATHIDDDGAYGIDEPLGWWLARSPPEADVLKLRHAIDADRAHATGARSVTYRTVAGVPLALHLLAPEKSRAQPRPAMLWLHGGSATEGTWWHSPVTTNALLAAGVVVVGVELTTGNRFDRDSDQFADASAAFAYVLANARELDLDPARVGVAGFSSGASVALLLATRGAMPSGDVGGSQMREMRPAAVIVSGACADPLSGKEDGYFRKMLQPGIDPAELSPIAQIRPGQPPILAVHAVSDQFCAFEDMTRFSERYQAAGNTLVLKRVEGPDHFFGFYDRTGQELQRAAILEALDRWRW